MKKLLCEVYKWSLGDCTNCGISSKNNQLFLVWDDVIYPDEIDGVPTVKMISRDIFSPVLGKTTQYLHVEPVKVIPGLDAMAGGNILFSLDSRFPAAHALPIHDRYEHIKL